MIARRSWGGIRLFNRNSADGRGNNQCRAIQFLVLSLPGYCYLYHKRLGDNKKDKL
jgi:hypothetical protein